METKNLLLMVLSITVITAAVIGLNSLEIIKIEGIQSPKSSMEIESKESFEKGETAVFTVKAENSNLIKKISYISPTKTEEKNCNKIKCEIEFNEVFEKPSVFFIEIKTIIGNGQEISKKKKITVIETGKKCSDGTLFDKCTKEKPNYCNNGKIEENCEKCGCDKGECIKGSCIYKGKLEIESINLEKLFAKPKETIKINIKAKELPKEDFSLEVEWKEKGITEKNETITGNTTTIQSKAPEKEGIYELNVIYGEEIFSVKGVTIRNDSSAPLTPTGLTARKSEGKILIAWNPNTEDDLMEYRIYRSTEDNQAFTTYSYTDNTPKEETGKELELWANNYLYLTAVDYFGNESAPSTVIEAT